MGVADCCVGVELAATEAALPLFHAFRGRFLSAASADASTTSEPIWRNDNEFCFLR